jgi:hypothetical protein
MIKQNEIKMKLKSSSWPMYMEDICIIQIQRPSREGGTLVTGRTLDLPSVIELAPCKYKRVYFYFGVQKKLITY